MLGLAPGTVAPEVGVECAQIDVPLDYSKPEGRTTQLAFSRIKASSGVARSTVFGNPGGPGIDALDYWINHVDQDGAVVDSPVLHREFDLVSVQPRGLAGSHPLDCTPSLGSTPKTVVESILPTTPQILRDLCRAADGEYFRSINTENAARDVNQVRKILDLETIDYVGQSYGTAIGATYATLFPEHTRRLVLDSSTHPNWMWAEQAAQETEAQRVRLYEVFDWIAAHNDVYELGDTPQKVFHSFERVSDREVGGGMSLIPPKAVAGDLPEAIRGTPLAGPSLQLLNDTAPARARANGLWRTMTGQRLLATGRSYIDLAARNATFSEGSWPFFAHILKYYNNGGKIPQVPVSLHTAQASWTGNTLPSKIQTRSDESLYSIITCNENTTSTDIVTGSLAAIDRATGGDALLAAAAIERAGMACYGWPATSKPVAVGNSTLADAPLVLHSERDAVTPVAGGIEVADRFGGVLVTVNGDTHGAFRSGNTAVDGVVVDYLRTGDASPAHLPGKPAPEPFGTSKDGTTPAAGDSARTPMAGHHVSPDNWYGPISDNDSNVAKEGFGAGPSAVDVRYGPALEPERSSPLREAAMAVARVIDDVNSAVSGQHQVGAATAVSSTFRR